MRKKRMAAAEGTWEIALFTESFPCTVWPFRCLSSPSRTPRTPIAHCPMRHPKCARLRWHSIIEASNGRPTARVLQHPRPALLWERTWARQRRSNASLRPLVAPECAPTGLPLTLCRSAPCARPSNCAGIPSSGRAAKGTEHQSPRHCLASLWERTWARLRRSSVSLRRLVAPECAPTGLP